MNLSQWLSYFVSVLVICSPFSALPALLALTRGRSLEEKRKTALISGFAVGVILVVCTWIGGPLLQFLGISVASFQCAGGIVVFMIALSFLGADATRAQKETENEQEIQGKASIAVVPLAIPVIAGPGAISTVIVAAYEFPGLLNLLYLTLGALCVAGALGLTLYFAGTVEKWLGSSGINIVNRIGGLILAAIAVEMIAKGVIGLLGKTIF